jgi:predicted metal-dependent hydrolase
VLWLSKKEVSPPPAEIGGVRVRPSTRARRMSLRMDVKLRDIVLVFPKRASQKSALRFIKENKRWIEAQRCKLPPESGVSPGQEITVLGCKYIIVHRTGRGLTRFEGGSLIVHGRPEHLSRRLKDFLKKEALRVLSASAAAKAAEIGLEPLPVRIADPKTRWGSCGPDGRIMFSWRLLLAPQEVMDYVVAHEVAHRVHLNHSRKFWALCASLTADAAASRRWIRKNGHELMIL